MSILDRVRSRGGVISQLPTVAVGIIACVYVAAASRLLLGFFLLMIGALLSIAYLRLRQKRFELSPLALTESAALMSVKAAPEPKTNQRCTACGQNQCTRHKLNTFVDVDSIKISSAIDKELAVIVNLVVKTYVSPWYTSMSDDSECTDEMKMMMKHIVGKLVQRLRKADFPKWTINELVPIMFTHIESYLAAKGHCEDSDTEDDVYDVALRMFGTKHHAAMQSVEMYYRITSTQLMNLLLPPEAKNCRVLKSYFAEALTVYGFKPNIEFFSSPHYIFKKCTEILEPPPMEIPPLEHASHETYLLETMLPSLNPASAFTKSLDDILEDRDLLVPFQKFLENSGYIEALILYRNLELVFQHTSDGIDEHNLELVVSMAKDIYESFQSGPEFMQVYIKPGLLEALEATKNSVEPSTCRLEEMRELFEIAKQDMDNRLRVLFLKSEVFFKSLCGAREATLRRKHTPAPKESRKKTKGKTSDGLTQAEISAMNLPAPPSAIEELHPHLVTQEEQKKKGIFFRKKNKAKTLDFDKLQFAPLDPQSRRNRASTNSASTSPDLSGMRKATSSLSVNEAGLGTTPPKYLSSPRARTPTHTRVSDTSETSRPSSPKNELKDSVSEESSPSRPRDRRGSLPTTVQDPDDDALDTFESITEDDLMNSFTLTTLENVEVEVTGWERRHPGVRQYVVYHIRVLANVKDDSNDSSGTFRIRPQWNVYRRYSEFAELEKRLKALYPEYLCELPDKKRFGNMEKQHVDNRRTALNAYVQSLLSNRLVHTDHRCTETICTFLNPACNFKQYTPSYVVGNKFKASNMIKKHKENFASFVDLFLITEEESAIANRTAINNEIENWQRLRQEIEQKRAKPDTPMWNFNKKKKIVDGCFSDDPEPAPEIIGFSNKAAHLLGRMVGRLRQRHIWSSIVGLARFILGGTIEANVVALCAPMWDSDEAYIVYMLRYVKDMVFSSDAEDTHVSDEELEEQRMLFCETLKKQFPDLITKIVGHGDVDEVCNCIVEAFQNHRYNKQMVFCCVDAALKLLFPELDEVDEDPNDKDN